MSPFVKQPIAALLALGALAAAQAGPLNPNAEGIYRPTGKGHGELDEAATADAIQSGAGAEFFRFHGANLTGAAAAKAITNHGGPVMSANTNVYYIWYGTWTAAQKAILTGFMQTIGGTPIFNTNTTYYTPAAGSTAKQYVKNVVTLAGQHDNNYSLGKTLSDAGVQSVVASAISGGWFPRDANGVYFVLTAPDVRESSGFGSQYCGWHTYANLGGTNIKYSFVGNPAVIAPSGCGVVSPSPNGDGGVDAMTSVIFHELSETVSDPLLNAWYDSSGQENGDKCAWTFGTLRSTTTGAKYNVSFGGRNWKLQQNWVNLPVGAGCTLAY